MRGFRAARRGVCAWPAFSNLARRASGPARAWSRAVHFPKPGPKQTGVTTLSCLGFIIRTYRSGRLLYPLPDQDSKVGCLAWSPDSQHLAISRPPPTTSGRGASGIPCNSSRQILLNGAEQRGPQMKTDEKCPVCGAPLRPEGPEGQCVACLLRLGLRGSGARRQPADRRRPRRRKGARRP